MPLNINTVISALDKPTSLMPFFLKDSLDNTGRTIMAGLNGGKHEAREKFVEETGTSLFWIGGIPLVTKLSHQLFKNKFDSNIHFKRINSKGVQNYFVDELQISAGNNKNKFSKEDLSEIVFKGEKLNQVKNKLTKAGYVPNKTTGHYGKFHIGVSVAAVLTNLFMLTVVLPKFNQKLSKKLIEKEISENKLTEKTSTEKTDILHVKNNKKNKGEVSFGSLKEFFDIKNLFNFTKMAENAQLAPTSSMLLLDYGISGSRVTFIPRNKQERVEYAIKEGGIIMFFYYAADWIKKGFSALANKGFKTPIDLDYKIILDKEFAKNMQSKNPAILNFVKENAQEIDVIKFIDKELKAVSKNTDKNSVFKNFTLKMAQKTGLIDVEYDNELQSWIRHSKKYIETEKIMELNSHLKDFYNKSVKNCTNFDNVIRRTKSAKLVSVFGNIGLCCVSLSYLLPKLQYIIREKMTKSKEAPGIKHYKMSASA